jgi:hypothetical protein
MIVLYCNLYCTVRYYTLEDAMQACEGYMGNDLMVKSAVGSYCTFCMNDDLISLCAFCGCKVSTAVRNVLF